MNDAHVNSLTEHLWGKGPDPVYMILDGARDPQIYGAVRGSGMTYKCLFSGDLDLDLAKAAPYLLELQRQADFTRQLLKMAWGHSWGIFLSSPSPLEELRRHFRRFLRVQGDDGKTLYFRYYDPRVLRVYLPTCSAGETEAIFGPVLTYLMESSDP